MPEINHKLLKKYLKDLSADPAKQFAPVYLIFGEELLARSVVKRAGMFKSAYFINNGDGVFDKRILPAEAQFSPIRDILSADFNEDGYCFNEELSDNRQWVFTRD